MYYFCYKCKYYCFCVSKKIPCFLHCVPLILLAERVILSLPNAFAEPQDARQALGGRAVLRCPGSARSAARDVACRGGGPLRHQQGGAAELADLRCHLCWWTEWIRLGFFFYLKSCRFFLGEIFFFFFSEKSYQFYFYFLRIVNFEKLTNFLKKSFFGEKVVNFLYIYFIFENFCKLTFLSYNNGIVLPFH